MAVSWFKLKMPYGFRHVSEQTDMVIEQYKNGRCELWREPTMPTCTCKNFRDARSAKFHVNKTIKSLA
jgi:hypothetical protein